MGAGSAPALPAQHNQWSPSRFKPQACSPPLLPAFPSLQAGWAMAEGVLSYRCNGSTTPLKLGVEGDGQYA